MHITVPSLGLTLLVGLAAAAPPWFGRHGKGGWRNGNRLPAYNVQLGPRPYYLVNDMDEGPLKTRLQSCSEGPFRISNFSIGHRGAPLQFPEETHESLMAAARMGAGVLECDVAFTQDRQLVCRHSQCDLHTTTNILTIPELAAKCTQPFTPATANTTASAECCTSDITLAEYKTLCGKMDAFNASAVTPEDYLGGTPSWRTDLYATCGTVLSHKEFIALVDSLGLNFTPELKTPSVPMPFAGNYTQAAYAQQMIDEYKAAGIHPSRVWPQSFLPDDIFYWLEAEPEFGRQAVYLDERVDTPAGYQAAVASLPDLASRGVRIMAPSMPALLTLDAQNNIVPSEYAIQARAAGLDLITWSLERSGWLSTIGNNYYYSSVAEVINNDGDMYNVVDVLARQVGVLGLFTDWPATVTYYANCFGLN